MWIAVKYVHSNQRKSNTIILSGNSADLSADIFSEGYRRYLALGLTSFARASLFFCLVCLVLGYIALWAKLGDQVVVILKKRNEKIHFIKLFSEILETNIEPS